MRRLTIGLTAAVMLLGLAPSGALASDHGSRHLRRVQNARVVRFSGGALTIMLRNGSRVSGKVNRATELECTAPERMEIVHDGDQSANDGPGDVGDANQNEAAENQNEAAEPPENEAAEPPENDVERRCSTMNLRSGTVVRDAVLSISSSGRVWKKVELGL
jgi:hypothetical protein